MTKPIRVRFEIIVPASTPTEAPIFVAGSGPGMGGWQAAGLKAEKLNEKHYEAAIELEAGGAVEFKITRGDWSTVEVKRDGSQRQNRRRVLKRSGSVPVTVAQWQDVRHVVRGPVGLNEKHSVPSQELGGERSVMVHLPPGYFDEQHRAYPLLLMLDGQNLFDDATSYTGVKWAADEAVDQLVKQGEIEPIVVAGVWNGPERMREYHPDRPLAQKHEAFLAEELIPWLRHRYRLLPGRTGIAGSSMGGIISIHLGERRRELFTRIGGISPSVFAGQNLMKRLEHQPLPPEGRRLWMDMGTLEGGKPSLQGLEQLRELFHRAGWRRELACVVVAGGRHNEHDWARRLPKILAHLYPPI